MKNPVSYKITIVLWLLILPLWSFAQDDSTFNDIFEQMEQEFEKYRTEVDNQFNAFVDKNDKEFSDFLRKSWEQISLQAGVKQPKNPKPVERPVIEKEKVDNLVTEIETIEVEEEDRTPDVVKDVPITPGIQKEEKEDFDKIKKTFKFYGSPVTVYFDKALDKSFSGQISEGAIADYWDLLSETNHYNLVNQLLDLKTYMNLPDWGYYLLVKQSAEQLHGGDNNSSVLLTWYLLIKSRYIAKVGFDDSRLYLLLPSNDVIYGKKYYTFNNVRYFVVDDNAGRIKTYGENYPDAKMLISMSIDRPVNLTIDKKKRTTSFVYDDLDYSFDIEYNKNNALLYDDLPQTKIDIYFNAPIATITKESLLRNLKPVIQNKSEIDAVNFLLAYVQKAYDYKTDPEQFGREKYFYAEEMLHYPYSDCEDRSVLFAYLVRELVGLEVIGLGYPGHMSTAVKFTEDVSGDFITHKNEKYIISDATYINARVGMCMPQFVGAAAKVVELKNREAVFARQTKIETMLKNAGAVPGAHQNIIFEDENAYAVGFFNNQITIQNKTIKAKADYYNSFLAKFDADDNLIWLRPISSEGNNYSNSINIHHDGSLFVAGAFDSTLVTKTANLKAVNPDGFLMKLDKNGNEDWTKAMGLDTITINKDYIYAASFSTSGEKKAILLYDEKEHFDNYGIALREGDLCIVTGGIAYADGNKFKELSKSFNSSTSFNFGDSWIQEYDRLVADNYDKAIAGLFAFLNTVKLNGSSINGQTAQDAINKYNPNFRKSSPQMYQNIGKITRMKNSGGIITVSTENGQDVRFNVFVIKDNAKLKITTYKGGNAQINIFSGATIGDEFYSFDLNHIKLFKTSGDIILDYAANHDQKKLNLKRDLLR